MTGNHPRDYRAFEIGGRFLVYFPRTVRLYELDSDSWRALSDLTETDIRHIRDPAWNGAPDEASLFSELRELLNQERLLAEIASTVERPQKRAFKKFTIYVSQACNMNCIYCWNSGGSFGEAPGVMDFDVARKVASEIVQSVKLADLENVSIDFYGGEPLLNFGVIELLTTTIGSALRATRRDPHFGISTNGLLLSGHRARFLADRFHHVGVSLDGRSSVHDAQRLIRARKDNWSGVVKNISEFPNRNILSLRATLTKHSDSYLDTFLDLAELGVKYIAIEYCSIGGRFESRDLQVDFSRRRGEMIEFVDWLVGYLSRYSERERLPFVPGILGTVDELNEAQRYALPCSAGETLAAIDCRGRFYPCLAFAAMKEFSAADLRGICRVLPEEREDWVYPEPCQSCWARYDCAGGCLASNYEINSDLRSPASFRCSEMKNDLEVSLYALARIKEVCGWHLDLDRDQQSPPYR